MDRATRKMGDSDLGTIEVSRRDFLGAVSVTILTPLSAGCSATGNPPAKAADADGNSARGDHEGGDSEGEASKTESRANGLPLSRPENWDPVAFNLERGAGGAIPAAYMEKIEAPDGIPMHLGKHLPYVPKGVAAPANMLALMWGDPERGYAKHPNAAPTPENPAGHWYNWIRVRRAEKGAAEELESRYSDWPRSGTGDSGAYAAATGTDPAIEKGTNTVYLAALPPGVKPGEWVRIHAHCLTHGEYVDFVRVPD